MAVALVSDIHSNIEAMEAVLKDIESQGISDIYCLGDVIDYGPNPCEVLDIAIERFTFTILGNHEEALMAVAEDFNERALKSRDWTRDEINSSEIPREKRNAYWNFIDNLTKSRVVRKGDILFLHGSPRQPTRDYIFPKDIKNPQKMTQIFSRLNEEQRFCFCGHSHIPGIYTEKFQYAHPSNIKSESVKLQGFDKLLINIGSVGQPRDNDTRASYCVLDDHDLYFRRVEYDYQKTSEKLRAIEELPPFLAERLLLGK